MQISDQNIKETITTIYLLVAIVIGVFFGAVVITAVMPDVSVMNNRTDMDSVIRAISSLVIVVILVMLFNPLRTLTCYYIYNKARKSADLIIKAAIGLLMFLYTLPVYYLMAKRPGDEEGFGFLGSPIVVINQVSDFSLLWIFDAASWIALAWGVGTFIYFLVKSVPIVRIYSEGMAEKTIEKTSAFPASDSKDDKGSS